MLREHQNQECFDTHASAVDDHVIYSHSPVVEELMEQSRQKRAVIKSRTGLTNQIRAKCYQLADGDKPEAEAIYGDIGKEGGHMLSSIAALACAPLIEARLILQTQLNMSKRECEKIAKQLDIAPWVDTVRGLGFNSVADIIGETGDLNNYDNPAKVWKRMGLAVMSDGTRQRRVAGLEAVEHGYVAGRRAVVWVMGDVLIKSNGGQIDKETGEILRESGCYKKMYDKRKEYELPRVQESKAPKMHAHNRAKRYMEKALLKDMWQEWTGVEYTNPYTE